MGQLDKDAISRRSFLKSSTACAGAAALAASGLPSYAMASVPLNKYLFVICCEGGWDNVLINYRDPAYAQLRGQFALRAPGNGPESLLDIDGTYGMHPYMQRLHQMIMAREMTAYHAVELADHRVVTGNHFTALQQIYKGGNIASTSGFLNRLTQELEGGRSSPGAVSLTESTAIPDIIAGGALVAGMTPTIPVLTDQQIVNRMKMMYGANHIYARHLQQSLDDETRLRNSLLGHEQLVNNPILNNTAFYLPQIAEISALLMQGGASAPNIIFTRVGGLDFHGSPITLSDPNNGPTHFAGGNILRSISDGIGAFRDAMMQANLWDKSMVIVMSEFGRSMVMNNAEGGTDHGHAQPMFVAGGNSSLHPSTRVASIWPGMNNLGFNNGLRATVDGFDILRTYLRAFYGAALSQAASERVLPPRQLDLTVMGRRKNNVASQVQDPSLASSMLAQ